MGVQTADNVSVTDVDLTDTFINAPVRTISGQQAISLQLLEQSPLQFDDIVFRDLTAAHAAVLDTQCLYGSGSNGEVLGITNTPGISTISVGGDDIQSLWNCINNAIQLIHTTRFLPPEVILMHPRRWSAICALLDNNDRPLVVPRQYGPFNAGGILSDVDSQCVTGSMAGLPVVTDPNLSTSEGAESPVGDEDSIYVMRVSDVALWTSGIRARVCVDTLAPTLTVLCQLWSYVAFSGQRYPQSIVEISGFQAPTFS